MMRPKGVMMMKRERWVLLKRPRCDIEKGVNDDDDDGKPEMMLMMMFITIIARD